MRMGSKDVSELADSSDSASLIEVGDYRSHYDRWARFSRRLLLAAAFLFIASLTLLVVTVTRRPSDMECVRKMSAYCT
jgi:hypothetical protein